MTQFHPSRRSVLQAGVASAILPGPLAWAAGPEVTGELARYMVAARSTPLPDAVTQACKHRILDTFAAVVSGARMEPGIAAVNYIQAQGGTNQASVIASTLHTPAVNAALANAMCAPADETADFEPATNIAQRSRGHFWRLLRPKCRVAASRSMKPRFANRQVPP